MWHEELLAFVILTENVVEGDLCMWAWLKT